jgi:hypothetical protein
MEAGTMEWFLHTGYWVTFMSWVVHEGLGTYRHEKRGKEDPFLRRDTNAPEGPCVGGRQRSENVGPRRQMRRQSVRMVYRRLPRTTSARHPPTLST